MVLRNDGVVMFLLPESKLEEVEVMRSVWGFEEPGGNLYLALVDISQDSSSVSRVSVYNFDCF